MEALEKQRFESWKNTKQFRNQNINLHWPISQNEVIGYFSYGDKLDTVIIITDDGRFYNEKHKVWDRLEAAELNEWYLRVCKVWEVPQEQIKPTFLDIIRKIEKSGITPEQLQWIISPDFHQMLNDMEVNGMTLKNLIGMMEANQIDGDDIDHLQEKFDNHIEDCYPVIKQQIQPPTRM